MNIEKFPDTERHTLTDNFPTPQAVLRQLHLEALHQDGGIEIAAYGAFVGSVIECHAHLPRAMEHGRGLIATSAASGRAVASGTVILAETMSLCKGRFSRSWHAPSGGLWGCMIFADTLLPQWRGFIPLTVGIACCQAIHEICELRSSLRWVNDVLVLGKKMAGFLVESYTEPLFKEEFALVGFGINVNNDDFPPELKDTATSLCQVLGTTVDLTRFTTIFLAKLAYNFGILCYEEARDLRGQGFSGKQGRHLLLDRWLDLSDSIGKRVLYGFDVMNAPQYEAEVMGVDSTGGLILRLADGSIKTELSGEIRYLA